MHRMQGLSGDLRGNSSAIPATPPVAAHKRKREKAGTPHAPAGDSRPLHPYTQGNMRGHPAPRQGTAVPCTPAQQLHCLDTLLGFHLLLYRITVGIDHGLLPLRRPVMLLRHEFSNLIEDT